MRTEVKAAIAGTVGVTLLLGGAGTLAYWSDAEDVGTANIDSGSLTLSSPDCSTTSGAHDWQLDDGTIFVPGTTELVPGDVVSRVCDMTLTLDGEHIGATLAIGTPTVTASEVTTLDTELAAAASFTVDGVPYEAITAPGTYAVRATVTVTLPATVTSVTSQNGDVNLEAIQVTATQTHG